MATSKIHIENCQIISLEKAKLFCSLLDQLEKEFGIKSVRISLQNVWICPDIDLSQLQNTPMEKLVSGLIK